MFSQLKNLSTPTWVVLGLAVFVIALFAYNIGVNSGAKMITKTV